MRTRRGRTPLPTRGARTSRRSSLPVPGNPLGTRALYLNAPGIRIHGTSDVGSIGTNASHGCIRMLMSDVEEMYPLVPIGTRVIVYLGRTGIRLRPRAEMLEDHTDVI